MTTLPPFQFKYARSDAGVLSTAELTIKPNSVIWIVGSSGSGKSTLLHLLKGFYPEFLSGELNSSPQIFNEAFQNTLYVSQNPLAQIVHERVGEEFFFTLENALATTSEMQAARGWMADFGLLDQEFAPTAQLSHGLGQRLMLASQLAARPSWLMLDEPTAFLNPVMRDDFYDTLAELKGQCGIVLIDHHTNAATFADVCWHVDMSGVITEMSVNDWMNQQALEYQQELDQPTDDWQVPKLETSFTIQAQELTVGYKKKPLFTANFSLKNGQCAILSGENGAGKSTLLNTLAGMQKPLSGQFNMTQNSQHTKKPSNQMAYVFQHPDSHFFFDTIGEELQQLGVIDIDATLTRIGLPDCAARSPHQLSEGQKRRLTLLYPCLQSKALILLDEPTFGQDNINALRITRLILALKQAGHAVIVITHDLTLQNAIADVVWHIDADQFWTTIVKCENSPMSLRA